MIKIWEHAFEHIKNTLERTFWDWWSLNVFKSCLKIKKCVLLFQDLKEKPNFLESALFNREMVGLTIFLPDLGVCIVTVMISIKNICQNSSGTVLMNCWRSQLCWSPLFCKTYKLLCNMWCVLGEMWCVMFKTWFFDSMSQREIKNTPSQYFQNFLMIFQNWSQVAVVCTLSGYPESWSSKFRGSDSERGLSRFIAFLLVSPDVLSFIPQTWHSQLDICNCSCKKPHWTNELPDVWNIFQEETISSCIIT